MSRGARRQLLKAQDGVDVVLLLGFREGPPVATDAEILQGTAAALALGAAGDAVSGDVVRKVGQLVELGRGDRS